MSHKTKSKKSKPAKASKPKTAVKTAPKKTAPQKGAVKKPQAVKPAPVKAAAVKPNPASKQEAVVAATAATTGGVKPVRKDSKLDVLIQLLSRPEGATLEDMMASTGWLKHTVRSALSHALAKKRRYDIVSDKPKDGPRIYKIASAQNAEDTAED